MRTVSYCTNCGIMMQHNGVSAVDQCEDCIKKPKRKQRVHDSANIPYPKFLQELRTKTLATSKADD